MREGGAAIGGESKEGMRTATALGKDINGVQMPQILSLYGHGYGSLSVPNSPFAGDIQCPPPGLRLSHLSMIGTAGSRS